MNDPSTRPPIFPRGPLLVGFGLVAVSLIGAVIGRGTDAGTIQPAGSAVTQRELRFEDRSDGAVIVYAGADSRPLDVLTGENGFLRGTLRGLARARRMEGASPAAPFRLTAWSSGGLTLDDPVTGRRIELEAFGPTNTAVFARLLTLQGGTL